MPVAKKSTLIKKEEKEKSKKVKTISKKTAVKKKTPVKKKASTAKKPATRKKITTVKKKAVKKEVSTVKKKIPKVAKIKVRVVGGGIKKKEQEEIEDEVREEIEEEIEEVLEEVLEDSKNNTVKEVDIDVSLKENKTNKIKKTKKKKSKSISLYRRIASFFIFLTIILIGFVSYFSFVSLTIYVSPDEERISDKLSVTVYNAGKKDVDFSSNKYIKGVVEQIPIREEKMYEATGANIIEESVEGKVRIVNKSNKNQPLITNTRVLADSGKLFRIKRNIVVPAGGEVEVEIKTDEPSKEMAIAPTHFIIPGLWAGLQSKVYAESDESFVYRAKTEKFVQQSDIDRGIKDLKDILMQKAKDNFGTEYRGYDKIIYALDRNSTKIELDVEVGDKVDKFKVSVDSIVNIVGVKKSEIGEVAKIKLTTATPSNKKIIKFDDKNIDYNLGNYNFDAGVATMEITFSGIMTLSDVSKSINKEKIVGLKEDQLKDYLTNLNKFNDFRVVFSPSFIKTAPTLIDRIKIKIDSK